MGAHMGTYNPDFDLHSTTRIPSSDHTGFPFSVGSYHSAGDTVGIFYALPTGQQWKLIIDLEQLNNNILSNWDDSNLHGSEPMPQNHDHIWSFITFLII